MPNSPPPTTSPTTAAAARDRLTDVRLITTDGGLSEFLANTARLGTVRRLQASRAAQRILDDPNIDALSPTHGLFLEGLKLYRSYDDETLSRQDCISIAVMRERDLADILTLDRELAQAGPTLVMTRPATEPPARPSVPLPPPPPPRPPPPFPRKRESILGRRLLTTTSSYNAARHRR